MSDRIVCIPLHCIAVEATKGKKMSELRRKIPVVQLAVVATTKEGAAKTPRPSLRWPGVTTANVQSKPSHSKTKSNKQPKAFPKANTSCSCDMANKYTMDGFLTHPLCRRTIVINSDDDNVSIESNSIEPNTF